MILVQKFAILILCTTHFEGAYSDKVHGCKGCPTNEPGIKDTSLFATCDNLLRIYFDGVLQFEDEGWPGTDTYQWTTTTELVIPSGTKVLGIECKDLGGEKGILASTPDGLVTDGSWQCSHNENLVGWAKPGFEDSAGDFSEALIINGPVASMRNIDNSAQWIWADQGQSWAACRKILDSTCGAKSVTGDSIKYYSECYITTLNHVCAPVQNLLTHSDNEKNNGINGPSTFWGGPNGNNANFTLDLGCQYTFDTIQLVNTHASSYHAEATKLFNLYVGQTNTGPWTLVLVALLYDSRNDLDPLPVQCIPLQTGEETAQFILFELITAWGAGGGLQFFDIVRKSDAIQCVATHLNQNKGTTGTTGTGRTDDRIICDENLTKLHELLLDANNTIEVRCCANGYTNKTVRCGNGTDCSSVCGDTPTCAKVVVNAPKEGKNYCESKDQNNQDIHTHFIGSVPCDASTKSNCNDVSIGTNVPPETNTYCDGLTDITIPETGFTLVENFDFTATCRYCDPNCEHCSICPSLLFYNDKIAEFIDNLQEN